MFSSVSFYRSWWKRKVLQTILIILFVAINLVFAENPSQNKTDLNASASSSSTNTNSDTDSGEYYYYDDDEPSEAPSNGSKPLMADEYYYYYEEIVMVPKNASGVVKLKHMGNKINSRRPKSKVKEDSVKSESGHGHVHAPVLPSATPLKELATPIDIVGPSYTDKNYNHVSWDVPKGESEEPLGDPLGPGDFLGGPPMSYYISNQEYAQGQDETYNPEQMKPPPLLPLPTPQSDSEGDGDGVELSVVKHVNSFEDAVKDLPDDDENENHALVHENGVLHNLYFDKNPNKDPKNPLQRPQIHTQLSIGVNGWSTKKNPFVQAKEFLYHLAYIFKHLTQSDVIFYAEKFFNLVAELSVPAEHYLRVVSFAGVYLFLTMLVYRAENLTELKCTVENQDQPLKRWKFHAARRFVPARSVDPHMQKKFLKLFRGVDEEDEDFSDLNSLSRSSEEYSDELDFISEMCPRDSFFYSLNPRHIEAYTTLQKIFIAQESPADVLSLAKHLLHSEKVNPKIWYFGIVGAFIGRQDMTGFSIAHPLDAIPDWYIPGELIEDLVKAYRKIRIKRSTSGETVSLNKTISSISSTATAKSTSAELRFETNPNVKVSQLSLPVKSENGSYTVTIVTSSKNETTSGSPEADINTSAGSSSSSSGSIESVEALPLPLPTTGTGKSEDLSKSDETSKPSGIKHVTTLNHIGVKGELEELPVLVKKIRDKKKKKGDKKDEEDDHRHHHHHRRRHKKKGKKKDKCIKVDWKVGIDNGVENKLFYFREDLMLNQHHWYWHQFHPPNSTRHADRRAELFFYMHRAFVARYNAERLSNGLPRIAPLHFRPGGRIYEGYHSHLADVNSGTYWTARWPHTPLSDVHHLHDPDFALNITMAGYLTLYNRIMKAIRTGKILTEDGFRLPIDHTRGIEPLGNTIEASDLSVNPRYYDTMGIHALGHIMVGLAADPDYRFRKVTGVMSDAAVSMRDPSFYSYHLFMDNIFEKYKETLPPYDVVKGEFPLLWKGVEVTKVSLHSQGGAPINELRTFWAVHKFELSPGVDRTFEKGKKESKICAQHLDHEPFYFKIVIDRKPCVRSKTGMGTVRIFMAPRYDEKGRRIPVKIQRRLMFPLDVFTVKLKVGRNTITRYAEDSSLTQPWTKSLRDLERGPEPSGAAEYCGCGFPQHLYIPKGHTLGMAFDLFVMLTNYDEDHVPNDPKILETPETCNSPYIFCGIPGRRYPDRRPMGYPFDRPLFKSLNCPPGWTFSATVCKSVNLVLHNPIDTLEEFVSKAPNMAMLKFHIRHMDAFYPEPARHR